MMISTDTGVYIASEIPLYTFPSGLGTSSILAGGVIAALWRASGKTYDHASLIHAVSNTQRSWLHFQSHHFHNSVRWYHVISYKVNQRIPAFREINSDFKA